MLNSFYISPRIKRIGNGEVCSDYDVQKRISGASKGNMILITGEAGTGKSCFLKKCFLEEFKRRKKDTIVFWVSAELINEKKPKNQFHFFNKILKLKYAKKNRVIIFIDGVDEIFNNEKKNAIEYIEKLRELNICVILGCRRNYYGRIFQKVSFTEIYEIENWKEDQIEKYVKNYLGFCKKEYLYHEIFEKQNCESFLVNPFQCSMLLHLIVSLKKEQIDEIGNIYVLYETFYKYWIYREKERTDSFLEIKDINNIHYKIAREFYRTYNKAFSISKILSPKQKELDCQNQEVIISLLKMRNLFEVESCVAEGFMHMSLCEFLVAKSIIDALLRGGIKLIQSFSLPYRHFEMDFLENGLKSLKLEDARKIKENLENAYILLMPESFREKHYPDMIKEQRWEKRLEQIGNKKLQIIRDQMIFYLGKLPEILIENSKIFEYAFEEDESILVRDVVPIFSREGYPIFLFRPSSNMWSIVLEGKTKYIIPHGWGQELRYDYFAKQIQKEDFKNGKLSIKNGKFVLSNSQHGYYEKKFDIDYSARFNKKQVGVRDLYKTDKFDGKNIFGDTPYIKGTIEEILDPVALFSSDTEGAVKYYVSGEEN